MLRKWLADGWSAVVAAWAHGGASVPVKPVKPVVVSLYDPHDGSQNADLAVAHLQNKGIEVVLVSSAEGMGHPIFKDKATPISGIYLPGGADIVAKDPRTVFETQLIETASKADVPLLGICRGMQAIGRHYGFPVSDLKDYDAHYAHFADVVQDTNDPNYNNRVVAQEGSPFYQALQLVSGHVVGSESPLNFSVACLHHQHVEEKQLAGNAAVDITLRNAFDHTIEGLRVSTGQYDTVGYQHHPERVIDSANEMRQANRERIHDDIMRHDMMIDPEFNSRGVHQALKRYRDNHKKTVDEKAARMEFKLFINQVKEKHQQQSRQSNQTLSSFRL